MLRFSDFGMTPNEDESLDKDVDPVQIGDMVYLNDCDAFGTASHHTFTLSHLRTPFELLLNVLRST